MTARRFQARHRDIGLVFAPWRGAVSSPPPPMSRFRRWRVTSPGAEGPMPPNRPHIGRRAGAFFIITPRRRCAIAAGSGARRVFAPPSRRASQGVPVTSRLVTGFLAKMPITFRHAYILSGDFSACVGRGETPLPRLHGRLFSLPISDGRHCITQHRRA